MNKEEFIIMLINDGFTQTDSNGFIFSKDNIEIVLYMTHYAIKKYEKNPTNPEMYGDYIQNSYPTFPFDMVMFKSDLSRI